MHHDINTNAHIYLHEKCNVCMFNAQQFIHFYLLRLANRNKFLYAHNFTANLHKHIFCNAMSHLLTNHGNT